MGWFRRKAEDSGPVDPWVFETFEVDDDGGVVETWRRAGNDDGVADAPMWEPGE